MSIYSTGIPCLINLVFGSSTVSCKMGLRGGVHGWKSRPFFLSCLHPLWGKGGRVEESKSRRGKSETFPLVDRFAFPLVDRFVGKTVSCVIFHPSTSRQNSYVIKNGKSSGPLHFRQNVRFAPQSH